MKICYKNVHLVHVMISTAAAFQLKCIHILYIHIYIYVCVHIYVYMLVYYSMYFSCVYYTVTVFSLVLFLCLFIFKPFSLLFGGSLGAPPLSFVRPPPHPPTPLTTPSTMTIKTVIFHPTGSYS